MGVAQPVEGVFLPDVAAEGVAELSAVEEAVPDLSRYLPKKSMGSAGRCLLVADRALSKVGIISSSMYFLDVIDLTSASLYLRASGTMTGVPGVEPSFPVGVSLAMIATSKVRKKLHKNRLKSGGLRVFNFDNFGENLEME